MGQMSTIYNLSKGIVPHDAAFRGHQEIIAFLPEADSSVSALQSSSQTLFDVAAAYAHSDSVKTLLTAKGWFSVDGDHRRLPLQLLMAQAFYRPF